MVSLCLYVCLSVVIGVILSVCVVHSVCNQLEHDLTVQSIDNCITTMEHSIRSRTQAYPSPEIMGDCWWESRGGALVMVWPEAGAFFC